MKSTRVANAVRIGIAAAAAVLGVGAPPAGAAVYERFIEADHYEFSYDDCGFPVEVAGDMEQRYRVRTGTGPDDGAFFLLNRYSFTEVQRNPETGAYITIVSRGLYNEVTATRDSGNVFEFMAVDAGQPMSIFDSDGNLVLRDRGAIRFHVWFDTLGDGEPGGEPVSESEPTLHGPHPLWDADFCAVITPLIGS
jgi:hypothetical protein